MNDGVSQGRKDAMTSFFDDLPVETSIIDVTASSRQLAAVKAALLEELRHELPGVLLEHVRGYVHGALSARVRQEVTAQMSECKLQLAELLSVHAHDAVEKLHRLGEQTQTAELADIRREFSELKRLNCQRVNARLDEELRVLRGEVQRLGAVIEGVRAEAKPLSPKQVEDSLLVDLHELERFMAKAGQAVTRPTVNTLFGDEEPLMRPGPRGHLAFEEKKTLHPRMTRPTEPPAALGVRSAGALITEKPPAERPTSATSRTIGSLTRAQDLSTNLRTQPAFVVTAESSSPADDSILKYMHEVRQARQAEPFSVHRELIEGDSLLQLGVEAPTELFVNADRLVVDATGAPVPGRAGGLVYLSDGDLRRIADLQAVAP